MRDIEIRELGPELLEDYVYFMEHDAFGGNPDWEGCYCREGHWAGSSSAADTETRETNKTVMTGLIAEGSHTGLLAYEGGRVVGWCHAEPLAQMQNPEYRLDRTDQELAGIGAIVCFNLAASHRRQGLPGVLLRAAVERFRELGLTAAEAYPWKEPSPRPGRNYLGTVHLYELHGFSAAGESEDAVVMRRDLTIGGRRT
jgi:GNAT superfamily N-acetyltransferase